MTKDELNGALLDKMRAEQETYRDWLLSQPPEEILNHTLEYTVRSDILTAVKSQELNDAQAAALLRSPSPLADIFKDFCKIETDYMETIHETLNSRANTEIQKDRESREALRSLPVYRQTGSYAREHNELEQYRESRKANVACKDAIEAAVRGHVQNSQQDSKAAIKEVVDAYGYERTLYVLANTIKQKDWDERFSWDNKSWAARQNVVEDLDAFGSSRNVYFCVDQVHPVYLDAFVTDLRREYLLTQPLSLQEIIKEAKTIYEKLQSEPEPNSPNKTHFMAQISPDFVARAGSRDMTALQRFFPFKSLTLTTMKDRKGVFAVIAGDENRKKKLREPRQSVIAKLQEAPADTKKKTEKKKEQSL